MQLPILVTDRVKRALVHLDGIHHGIVVAVSGGADSVSLLHLILAVRKPDCPIVVAHLNHQLRGQQSDSDEHFVKDLVDNLIARGTAKITVETTRMDVQALARHNGANLEALARDVRYRWLTKVANENAIQWVATGHTADDQAETVLHRLLRGSGLKGMQGILAVRLLENPVRLVRPLLQIRREELVGCLKILRQPFCVDQSNDDCRLTRNRIRHELLPLLKNSYNPNIVETLARLADQAGEAFLEDENASIALLGQAMLPKAGNLVILDSVSLILAGRNRIRSAFRLLWQRESWPLEGMDFASWERLADLVLGLSKAVDLSGSIHARKRGTIVQIGPISK